MALSARIVRRPLVALAGATAALLVLAACSSAPDVTPTGETTEVAVSVEGMRFVPDTIEVPVGNKLVIEFTNTGDMVHDLVLADGSSTDHLAPGASETIDAGVIGADMDGWCSVSNHRAQGMVLKVKAVTP
ncbi:cupredoxin domain-containing protein [Microbacterium sp. ARD32]|uniref:cupredoxin domain-containing protein n=1 Tax=Microbacterium sp. ARD32 TaxID=2962577 RepID=UPI00288104AD|nr:cupredoxin domain-containing protein [Microbacterium sp. ARD32]MDT0157855.1 cupredoxin domain-containing protein [Microbacterium sp. ARD32]